MKLLAIDTSGPVCGVAVLEDGRILYEGAAVNKLTHSVSLMPMVEEALNKCSTDISEIELYAAVVGPGSCTGVRIGVSAVKGMAHGAGKPCVAVDALEALAWGVSLMPDLICPIQDARAGQVYGAAFQPGRVPQRVMEDTAAKLEDYLETAPNEYFEGANEKETDNAENQAQSDTERTAESTGEATQNTAPTSEASTQPEKKVLRTAIVYSPVTGIAADLSTAPDEGFAEGMMGEGAVVTPKDPVICAPEDGEVEFIFDTKHAIGFQTDTDLPMLLHIGIDTVKLEGKGFEILVEQGQHVKKGEPLMKIDIPYLTENAPSLCSPILCTEIEDDQRVRLLANGEIKAGEPLFAVETVEE